MPKIKDESEKIEKLVLIYRTFSDTKLIELYALLGESISVGTRLAYEQVLKERDIIA